jgi:hypothetical protein
MVEDKNKKLKHIQQQLFSGDKQTVLSAIEHIRAYGENNMLPFIFGLLSVEKDEEIILAIKKLLSDLTNQSSANYIVEAIHSAKNNKVLKLLVSSCWENKLDFSEYLPEFVSLVLSGNFEVSFEAFTVIENMNVNFPRELVNEQIHSLKNKVHEVGEEKQYLFMELIDILRNSTVPEG